MDQSMLVTHFPRHQSQSHSPHVASPSCDVIILPARTARSARPLLGKYPSTPFTSLPTRFLSLSLFHLLSLSRFSHFPPSHIQRRLPISFLPSLHRLFLFRIFLRLDPILPIPISRTQSLLGFRGSMIVELGFCTDLGFRLF